MITYKYGMRLRGFSPGCQPKIGFVERQDDSSGKYYDILVYDRKLSNYEITSFELDYLSESNDDNPVKALRARTGLSQAKFAEMYKIPKRSIENWETGLREPPAYVLELLTRAVKEDFPEQ